MPGAPLSEAEVTRIIRDAAQVAIQKYGIRNAEQFIQALIGIAWTESSFIPDNIGPSGEIGLFQCHPRGRGAGHSPENLKNPSYNARISADELGAIWADGESKGQGVATIAERLVTEGQRPAQEYVEREVRGILERMGVPYREVPVRGATAPGRTTAAGQVGLGFGAWVEQFDPTFPWRDRIRPDQPGLIGDAWLKTLTSQERAAKYEQYVRATGQGEVGAAPYERELAGAELTKAEYEIGTLPYGIDIGEYERQRQYWLDKIDAGTTTAEQAINKFYAWLSGAQEAGRRAETAMERAERTLKEEYFPQAEPRGMLATVAGRYDLPFTPLRGIPEAEMPTSEEMYSRWHETMGIPERAPALPEVPSIPAVPQPPGADAARAFVDDLLRRHQQRQAMGVA